MSSDYRIFETDQFANDLRTIARSGQRQVVAKLKQVVYPRLRQHPHFGPNIRKLKGYSPDTWRYRIGAWRFFYEIDDEERIVFMIAAEHRGSAY
ncbi:MAG TPA: type II toxin-antitoxin system RelE/ParE family toxin [Vicinamibacteria bacterium]|nr:type II toxin-antitoxin system RelE/ParE family toxin [Vicinamibacteria bacterium]